MSEENLAVGRATTQSDVLWSYGSELAVDGDPNTCSFTTRQEGQRWWQVWLGLTLLPQLSKVFHCKSLRLVEFNKQLDHFCCIENTRFLWKTQYKNSNKM